MDYESERTRKLGCWDGFEACTGPINQWTTNEKTNDFQPDLDYCNFLIDIGFGRNCSEDLRKFWQKTIQSNYQGDDGRRRARMAAINLRERDGLHGRLFDVKCPVMWLHVSSCPDPCCRRHVPVLTHSGHGRCRVLGRKRRGRDQALQECESG